MLSDSTFVDNFLKCGHCKKKYDDYDDPKILPCCGFTLCYHCIKSIEDVENSRFKCFVCKKESLKPGRRFQVNELAAQFVSDQLRYRRNKENNCVRIIITSLEDSVEELKYELKNGDYTIKEYFTL